MPQEPENRELEVQRFKSCSSERNLAAALSELKRLQRKYDFAYQALWDVAHPIEMFRRHVPPGYDFNAGPAIELLKNPEEIKRIAEKAIKALGEL